MLLIGNSFPLSLVRSRVIITPHRIEALREAIQQSDGFDSFWGHSNTLTLASQLLGYDLTPSTDRPSLGLSDRGLPTLNQNEYDSCWVLSPDYAPGFRPQIGVEVGIDEIAGWQVLCLRWDTDSLRSA